MRTIAAGPHSGLVVGADPAEWDESEVDCYRTRAHALEVLLVLLVLPVLLVLVLVLVLVLLRSGILKGRQDPHVLLLMMRWMNGLRILDGLTNLSGHP